MLDDAQAHRLASATAAHLLRGSRDDDDSWAKERAAEQAPALVHAATSYLRGAAPAERPVELLTKVSYKSGPIKGVRTEVHLLALTPERGAWVVASGPEGLAQPVVHPWERVRAVKKRLAFSPWKDGPEGVELFASGDRLAELEQLLATRGASGPTRRCAELLGLGAAPPAAWQQVAAAPAPQPAAPAVAAGWHPDPTGRHRLRHWDGAAWTAHVSDGQAVGVDPL